MEDHGTCGWSAVVADQWSSARRPASAFKVAHHGSKIGDCPNVWATLLESKPLACLTPFTKGRHRLPTDDDIRRVKENSSHAYISSGASRRPNMDSRQLKRLADICQGLSQVDAGFGAVRCRKKIGGSRWGTELFGAAQAL